MRDTFPYRQFLFFNRVRIYRGHVDGFWVYRTSLCLAIGSPPHFASRDGKPTEVVLPAGTNGEHTGYDRERRTDGVTVHIGRLFEKEFHQVHPPQ